MPKAAPRVQDRDPALYAEYDRHLIVYTAEADFSADTLITILKPFDPIPIDGFQVDGTKVQVYYLANLDLSVGDAIAAAASEPALSKISFERNPRLTTALNVVNDPLFAQQWALPKVEAEPAWARFAQAKRRTAKVAIVDWGVQRKHQDLDQHRGAIVGARVIPPNNNNFADDNGHGTMLAGIIGAVADNNLGVAGTVPSVALLAIKFIDQHIPPTALYATHGILYAVQHGAKIINASWHVGLDSGLLRLALHHAGNHGVVVVAAAGNSGSDNARVPFFPASYSFDNMIAVMASDKHDDRATFSNYGDNVDIAAPGTRILSTTVYFVPPQRQTPPGRHNSGYHEYNGTSTAAAFVSGAAALLLSIDDWTPRELREHLVASADPAPGLRGICRAQGRLNLRRAIVGPFSVIRPRGGERLHRGALYDVKWACEYDTPVVQTVGITVIDAASGQALSHIGGLPRRGNHQVPIPNRPVATAFVRVECEQKRLYADSPQFQIE